ILVISLGFAVYRQDIRARTLKTEEENLRNLFESAPDATVIIGKNGEIVLLNSVAERLFDYQRGELVGQPFENLLPERLRSNQLYRRALTDPSSPDVKTGLEFFGQRKDGSEFQAEMSISVVRTPTGLLQSAAIRDVTQRKHAEEALQQSEKR